MFSKSLSGAARPHCLGRLLWIYSFFSWAMQGNKVHYLLPKRDLDCRITRGRDGVSQEIMPTLKDKMD